jgi:hypothetical protein
MTTISRMLFAIAVAVTLYQIIPAPTLAAGKNVYIDSDGLLKANALSWRRSTRGFGTEPNAERGKYAIRTQT